MPKLIDAHTHIQFAAYKDDRDEVIKRSLDAGIWLVNVGTQLDTSLEAIKLAEKYNEGVYATVGLHPVHTDKSFHDQAELGEGGMEFTSRGEVFDYEEYKKLALHPKVVAIGECGLDYYADFARERSERLQNRASAEAFSEGGSVELRQEKQKLTFIKHIELAHEVKKPLMIHCREAFDDLIDTLKANSSKLQIIPGIIHFFSGNIKQATMLLDMGFYFTFGGVVTFTRDYDEIIKTVPVNRILLETDAPYVTPAPYRGQRNEPAYVIEVAKKIGEIKGIDFEEVSHHTVENTRAIFGI
ncbi:MAG: TatD family hydrolase [bacterium]|nr:TatD family hydrolase [bacterium]